MKLSKIQLLLLSGAYLFVWNLWVNTASVWVLCAWWILMLPFLFHRWILKAMLMLQIAIAALALFAKSAYQVVISEDILLSALMTEADLTAEMFSWRFIVYLILFGILPILLIASTKIQKHTWRKTFFQTIAFLVVNVAVVAAIFISQDYSFRDKGHIRDSRFMSDVLNFSPVDAQYNMRRAYKTWRNMQKNYLNIENLTQKYHYHSENDELLLVVVLGESTRGDRFALNGYSQPTNPQLSQIPDLYSFIGTSCDTLTINSLNCVTSPMLASDEGRQVKQSSFGQILRHLGYRTEIYSLQTLGALYAYLGYDKLLSKYQITANQNNGAKDVVLLPHILQSIANYRGGKQMIIAHTLGSHQTYDDRIDERYAPFEPYCRDPDVAKCQPEELNNAYDNTVVGVDKFLADTIAALKNKKALLIYFSDHGESLGEGGYYFHGQPVKTAPKEQFSIPVVFWFSDAYRETPQGKTAAERVAAAWRNKAVLSHDQMFHSILGCAGIVSDNGGINSELNICAQ